MTESAVPHVERQPIAFLTGLRGLAVTIVVMSHAANQGYLPAAMGHGVGQVGVMLFFLLSGFLMGHLYLTRDFTRSTVREYAAARVGRVVPLYVAVVVASVVISNHIFSGFRYDLDLDSGSTLIQAVLFVRAPYELWTIPVEVQFYVVFVAAWWLYSRKGRAGLLLTAALLTTPAVVYFALLRDNPPILPTYGFAFFIGVLTADLLPAIRRRWAGRVPSFVGAGFLALLIVNLSVLREHLGLLLAPERTYVSTWLDPVTWLIIYGLLLSCLLGLPSLWILETSVFTFLGEISYGLYLMHYPIVKIVDRFTASAPIGLALSLALSVGLATASFRYFERPMMSRVRRAAVPAPRR